MAGVAMIDGERFEPAMTDHGFRLAADCAASVLLGVHSVVVFLGDAIRQSEVSAPDLCRPLLAGMPGLKGLPILGTIFPCLLGRWLFGIFDQVSDATVTRVAIGKTQIASFRHLSFEHKPHSFMDRYAFTIYIDVPLSNWRSCLSGMPTTSNLARLDSRRLDWRILPTESQGLCIIVSEKVKELFSGDFHDAVVSESSGGRDLYLTCAA